MAGKYNYYSQTKGNITVSSLQSQDRLKIGLVGWDTTLSSGGKQQDLNHRLYVLQSDALLTELSDTLNAHITCMP